MNPAKALSVGYDGALELCSIFTVIFRKQRELALLPGTTMGLATNRKLPEYIFMASIPSSDVTLGVAEPLTVSKSKSIANV